MSENPERPSFRVFSTIARLGRTLLRQSWPSLILSAVVHLVWLPANFIGAALATSWLLRFGAEPSPLPAFVALAGLAAAPPMAASMAAYAADCEQAGRRATLGGAWAILWRHGPVCLLIAVGQALAITLGTALLVVTGIVAGLLFSLAIPLRVMEDLNPLRAFSRSLSLSAGNPWRLLGYFCIAHFLVAAAIFAIGYAIAVIGDLMPDPSQAQGGETALIVAFLGLVMALIGVAAYLLALVPAAAAAEFRAGQSDRAVPEVFD
ncbi:MAG: hypothetical protein GC145_05710 [Caulobacter sp.]|nr:hypothetical protein [Caulobacter sp.]